jgi:hypothetical protein
MIFDLRRFNVILAGHQNPLGHSRGFRGYSS